MKIGEIVRYYAADIFAYCDGDPAELHNLMDWEYSNFVFGLEFPFCAESDALTPEESVRYWKVPKPGFAAYFSACGKSRLRVTSQWYENNRRLFTNYLLDKDIIDDREQVENLTLPRAASAADIGAYTDAGDMAQMDEDVQTVLNRINRDIAWLKNRLTIPPKDGGDAKDFTQYFFNGKGPYGKGRFVLAVIRHWVEENAPANIYELNEAFPQNLTGVGRKGVLLMPLHEAQNIRDKTGHFRHVNTNKRIEFVRTGDGSRYAVSNQWKPSNIGSFINNARNLGYDIRAVK
ncbi:MAG: hypothetical protein ACR2P4_08755 [Gammaproteobacteria bacterium]